MDRESSIRSSASRVSGRSDAPGEAPSGAPGGPRGAIDDRTARMLHILRTAALAGQPAPTNEVLGRRLGLTGAYMSRLVRDAEEQGLIVVERLPGRRVVSAPDGSWRTA